VQATDKSLDPTIDASAGASAESLRAVALDPRTRTPFTPFPIDARISGDILLDDPLPARRTPFGAKLLFAVVLGGCAFVLALCGRTYWVDHTGRASRNALVAPNEPNVAAVAAPPTTAAVIPAVVAPPPPAAAPVPPPVAAVATVDPPKPTKSTIKLAKKAHALRVDGKLAKGSSVEVTCGPHLVAVGKQKARLVDAGCGRTVVVDAQKATVVDDTQAPARTRKHKAG
jgi:hypothetical protein